jgi:hypothetical protein
MKRKGEGEVFLACGWGNVLFHRKKGEKKERRGKKKGNTRGIWLLVVLLYQRDELARSVTPGWFIQI